MKAEELLQELESCAQRLGVEVRREKGDFEGGLCRVKDRRLIILNEKSPLTRQLRLLARELARLEVDEVYLVPAVRKLIEEANDEAP
ncbi:MAG: hypothetical protein ONB23_05240 [candidate division KSB1 bacterium]|nr:hypothetical protein [candidate division KSB1 bacterium]